MLVNDFSISSIIFLFASARYSTARLLCRHFLYLCLHFSFLMNMFHLVRLGYMELNRLCLVRHSFNTVTADLFLSDISTRIFCMNCLKQLSRYNAFHNYQSTRL